jgi:hypothetical protein
MMFSQLIGGVSVWSASLQRLTHHRGAAGQPAEFTTITCKLSGPDQVGMMAEREGILSHTTIMRRNLLSPTGRREKRGAT